MRWIVLLGVAALLLAGCGGPSSRTSVVVDTDMSTDDIVALLYVATSPQIDLRAVVVSGTGLATCPAGARNALDLLAVAGRSDVPVACGARTPLAGANEFPLDWRARADALFGVELPKADRKPEASGVDLLAKSLGTQGATVLSLAPLTDTAKLLRRHPDSAKSIDRVVAMAGAIRAPGNIGEGHEHSEFNLWVDPVAAREVFAKVPVTLVPLDATNDVPSTLFFSEALRRAHYATPAATAAWELFVQSPSVYIGGQYFWDPLAAVAVTHPELLGYQDMHLRVGTAWGANNGRLVRSAAGSPVKVAVSAQRLPFERELLGTLLGGAGYSLTQTAGPVSLTYDGEGCTYKGPADAEAGQVAFDTVNTGDRTFTYVVYDRDGGSPGAPMMRGDTPPGSRMTWLGGLPPGIYVIGCSTGGSFSRAAAVTLTGSR